MPRAPPSSLAKASELPLLSIGVEFIGPLWQLVFPLLQLLWRTGSTSVLNVTGVVVSPVDTYGVQLPGLPLLLPLLVLPLPLPLPLELPLDELSSPEHSIMPRRAVGVRRHTRMAIPRGDHEDKTLRCDTSIFFSFRCRCRAMLRRRRMVRDRSPPLHGRSPRVSGIAPGAAKNVNSVDVRDAPHHGRELVRGPRGGECVIRSRFHRIEVAAIAGSQPSLQGRNDGVRPSHLRLEAADARAAKALGHLAARHHEQVARVGKEGSARFGGGTDRDAQVGAGA